MQRNLSPRSHPDKINQTEKKFISQQSGLLTSAGMKKNSYNRAIRKVNKDPFNNHLQELMISARKTYRKACKDAESYYRKNMLNKLLAVEADNPKQFWKMIKNMKEWGQETPDPSNSIQPEDWRSYFTTLLNTPKGLLHAPSFQNLYIPAMDNRISEKELQDVIKRAKMGKACGPDGILIEYIKFATDNVLKTLLDLMNKIFCHAIYPTQWAINYLKAIYKKGSKTDPDNYRGLAIGSAVSKLYSMILLQRLELFISENNILSPNQIGFRKGYRTADHIFVLKTIVNKITRQKNKKLYVAFIDFKKAYDTINRTTLLERLSSIGIGHKLLMNIRAIYSNTNYAIKTKDKILDPISSNLGLKQGCPLSPLLFNIYINDITQYLQDPDNTDITLHGTKVTHFLYADDLVILSETKTGLQGNLDRLSKFAKKKDLTINSKKSKIMIFNKSGRKSKEQLYMEGNELENVQTFTYLGIDISASGSFTHAIKELSSKAKKAMIPLYKTVIQFQMPFNKSLRLFQTFIEPILLYNAENWSILTNKQITKCKNMHNSLYDIGFKSPMTTAQLKYFKFILGLTRQCPNMAVLGEVSETPLFLKAYTAMLKFWNRVRHMSDETLVNKAYLENVEMNSNWCQTIQILNASQNLNTTTHSNVEFPKVAKHNIRSNFTRYWKSRINDQNIEKKLELYSKVKHTFKRDPYLNIPSFRKRQILSKFLCSNHKLEIEIGRHKNIPRQDRLCKVCDLGVVEDESHFLIVCPVYSDIRNLCFEQQHINRAEDIFNCVSTLNIVKFLKLASDLRDSIHAQQNETYSITTTSLSMMQITIRRHKVCDAQTQQQPPKNLQISTNGLLKHKISRRKVNRYSPYRRK